MRLKFQEGALVSARASRGGPRISHLFFVDDYILFGEATVQGAQVLKDVLAIYESCSS